MTDYEGLEDLRKAKGLVLKVQSAPHNPDMMDDDWTGDSWYCELTSPQGTLRLYYSKGVGLRVNAQGRYLPFTTPKTLYEQEQLKLYKPVEPSLLEILHCLQLDATCLEEHFYDWAENLGYNSDSIKAKRTYDKLVEQNRQLRQLLADKYEEFLELELD